MKRRARNARLKRDTLNPIERALADQLQRQLLAAPRERPRVPCGTPIPRPELAPPQFGDSARLCAARRETLKVLHEGMAAIEPLRRAVEKLPEAPFMPEPEALAGWYSESEKWRERITVAEVRERAVREEIRQRRIAGGPQHATIHAERTMRKLFPDLFPDARSMPLGARPDPSERRKPQPPPPAERPFVERVVEALERHLDAGRACEE